MTTGSSSSTEELLKRLDAQHQAYLETFKLVHESLLSSKNNTNTNTNTSSYFNSNSSSGNIIQPPSSPVLSPTIKKLRRSTHDTIDTSGDRISLLAGKSPTFHSSIITGEDSSSSDDDEDLYVQEPLPAYKYDLEDLKTHLKSWRFNEEGKLLLDSVVVNGRLKNPGLFGDGDRQGGVGSHYSVYDVANDGSPLSRHEVVKAGTESIDDAIWQAIRDLNADPAKERKAVGRISIIREPAPVIFGALHLTMNEHFDIDELFSYLVSDSDKATTQAHMSQTRAFMPDHRRQRSFVFSFEYFTIIGEDCKPMPWQLSNPSPDPSNKLHHSGDHIPISRCSSIVALSLTGSPIRRLKNVSRRKKTMHGHVYDPWAPWHVLNFQCYPDLKHSMDSHDSTKHYVNGPEAFLHTLLAEFKDAQKRFEEIYLRITKLVTPPADFMFNSTLRDKLLFEDAQFTYSRRYFWAFQTLGIINNNIKSMIDSYEDTFTEDVWLGKHKYLWPMVEEDSARNVYWRKRMATLKRDFEREIQALRIISEENNERRKEIRTLRDQLFSGTSVLESRKSVEMASITIQQGHNIKLLTLVSIFFLPLTFVTSVFGMTNMPTEHQFYSFGIVMATVCIPFFLLIGSLNTTQGMEFWIGKWHRLVSIVTRKPIPAGNRDGDDVFSVKSAGDGGKVKKRERSLSQLEALARRKRRIGSVVSVGSEAGTGSGSGSGMGNTPSTSFGRGDGEGNNGNGANSGDKEKDNNGVRNKEGPSPPSLASMSAQRTEGEGRWSALREKLFGRKKRDREVELEHV